MATRDMRRHAGWASIVGLALWGASCGSSGPPAGAASPPATAATEKPASAAPAAAPAAETAEAPPEPAPEATPLPTGIAPMLQPFKGDLDGMTKRRVIRVLTVQNPVLY